jgi:hypothetical protein
MKSILFQLKLNIIQMPRRKVHDDDDDDAVNQKKEKEFTFFSNKAETI